MSKTRLPNKPAGKSKYALKVARRKALTQKLGVPVAPFPVLNSMTFTETLESIIESDEALSNMMQGIDPE